MPDISRSAMNSVLRVDPRTLGSYRAEPMTMQPPPRLIRGR